MKIRSLSVRFRTVGLQTPPMEAERIGAFEEDALSEQDALDSVIDQQA